MKNKKSNLKPKRVKPPLNKCKDLGSFKILSQVEEVHVKMDIEMTDDLSEALLKYGKKIAKNNPEFYIQLGFLEAVRASLPTDESSAGD